MEKGPAASLPAQPGLEELRARRRESRALYWAAGVFSFFVNLLMLAGPLYMLLIYDRVLASQSVESLTALSLLLLFLYGIMAVLDVVRGRVMARVGARLQARLDRRVFEASLSAHRDGARGLADLDALRQFLSAPVFIALFDIPWTPVFLLAIFLFHPALGWLAFGGAALLVAAALINQTLSRLPQTRAEGAGHTADRLSAEMRRERETLQGLGMLGAAFARWQRARRGALMDATAAADIGGSIHAMSRAFRLFLQSAMLGLGALLVLRGEVSAGAMIASSILLGRALAPVEQALAQWPLVMRAGRGWSALAGLLRAVPPARDRVEMPAPIGLLEVDRVTITAPGSKRAILSNISFSIAPGQACGVIGTSGAGKSALARAIIGLWPLASGTITLGGARIETYGSAALGRHLGYLPQRVALLEGTIAENIARFDPKAPDHAI
ncbi:MAG: ATP-binding cassette domain-containing protein, partial [Pseudomonadota bacterium]